MTNNNKNEYLRKISSVDEILNRPEIQALSDQFSREITVKAIQRILDEIRKRILAMADFNQFENKVCQDVTMAEIEAMINKINESSLKRVINASGIIVHTNLGRAPLSDEAIKAVTDVAGFYSNLEFDLEEGKRGSRYDHIDFLLKELTGAESGFVVNNNAAAVLLSLNALAQDREVIISRGELIEIGGSFRIPDIMRQSGACLVEVGTTNRTYLRDYQESISEKTAIILKAHTSNYRVMGFSSNVDLSELNKLGRQHNIPVMFDMGSGNFIKSLFHGIDDEPTVQEAVKSGTDIITFSGDKLLGGPQSGIILGKEIYIEKIKKNPLSRAMRIDKLSLAALEATLKTHALKSKHIDDIPVIRMFTVSESILKKRAQKLVRLIKKKSPFLSVSLAQDKSQVGGGSCPLHNLATWVVVINPSPLTVNEFEYLLRQSTPPVISRISRDSILLDMRTIFSNEDALIPGCVDQVINKHKSI